MPSKIEKDAYSGTETTGHEWDGLRELNTPLPKWWLYTFYVCCAVAFVYALLFPSVPGIHGYWHGLLGYSTRVSAMQGWQEMQGRHAAAMTQIARLPIEEVAKDPRLMETAIEDGRIVFANNCQPCHGQNGTGRAGYPALGDDVWLWGGRLGDIETTIAHGIRSGDPQARQSMMPTFSAGVLTPEQIREVANYVGVWWGVTPAGTDVSAGAKIFAENCVACHGDKGQGNRDFGAPPLNAHIHLYGGGIEGIIAQVTHPRHGVMPNWSPRLDTATIKSVAIFVHQLGGGE